MNSKRELTERERRYLELERQARAAQITLAQYCRTAGLNAREWYWVRQQLVRKGVLSAAEPAKAVAKTGDFIAVRVAPAMTSPQGTVCRVRHPSGWVMECASLPPASWIAECFGGGTHAVP